MFDQEHVEAGVRRQPVGVQRQRVVVRMSSEVILDGDAGDGMLNGWAGERLAGQQARVDVELERTNCPGARYTMRQLSVCQ